MDEERWIALKQSFAALSPLAPDEQARALAVLSSSDPALGQQLEALLAADARADSLLQPYELLSATHSGDAARGVDAGAGAEQPDPFGLAGQTVSHFRVREVLGCGGMGVVYRAEDLRLGRTVALKFLLPQYSFDDSAKQRFLQEARAASALDHPNVCTVHEVGESERGQLFLAMSCYTGETLKARLARTGPLPLAEAVAIGRQVLLGLGAAHAAGIVHRDLKPGNLMLMPDGTVKILDFGLAKVRDLNLTYPEQRLGTVAYMSPEQLAGQALDHRTDLWSLGAVLYEMLAGRIPFPGGHDLGTIYSILHEEPAPPSGLRAEIPLALDQLVGRLLRKEPAARFAGAVEARAELEATTTPGSERRAPRAGPRFLRLPQPALLAVAALLAAGAGILAVLGLRSAAAGDPADEPGVLANAVGLSSPAGEQATLAVLPFVNLSADPEQEYFSDGITEEVLNALSQVPEIRVPARTSSFFFKGRNVPIQEIAQQLQVAAVLEGSVRKAGSRVRISAQLVDARSDRRLWSHSFDREVEDIFAIQDEISSAIVEALRLRLAPRGGLGAAPPPTASVQAYELYLRGRFFTNRRTEDALARAAEYYTGGDQHRSRLRSRLRGPRRDLRRAPGVRAGRAVPPRQGGRAPGSGAR